MTLEKAKDVLFNYTCCCKYGTSPINCSDEECDFGKAIKTLCNRSQGEWARHDEWVGGEYVGGFYHVNCPCEDGYYSKWRTNFCPNCGHPMMKGGAE